VEPDYAEYLRDESRLSGAADRIAFPQSEAEVRSALGQWAREGSPVTVQGARTGISGGAVPRGGHILNLSRLNHFLGLRRAGTEGRYILRVEAGVLLAEINEALERRELPAAGWDDESLRALEELQGAHPVFFAPDPTEASASVGGMVASNASGARSFGYGPTRNYVQALRLLLPDGCPVRLHRGGGRARGLGFRLNTECGRSVEGELPSYRMPPVKNAAGLYCLPDMELIDLVIGAEGTLGVITELELLLLPRPDALVGLMAFFPDQAAVVPFVTRLRGHGGTDRSARAREGRQGFVAAIEFFDARALELLSRQKRSNPAFAELPEVPGGQAAAVYVELHGQDAEDRVLELSEVLEDCGGDSALTWLADNPPELERLKDFRHALPEAVNLTIDERRRTVPGLTKLGTDMSVPDEALAAILGRYHRDLEASDLEYVMFGHIGANHVHVNILPECLEDYRRGRELYEQWAAEVVRLGGSVSAEHGIGKLKTSLLRMMFGEDAVRQMRGLIERFNPGLRLNRGNMIGDP